MYKSSSSSLPNYSSSSVLCYVASPHERWWLIYRDPYIIRIVNPSPHSSGCGPKREGRGIHSLCFFLPFSFALFQSSHPHLAGTSAPLPARLNLRPLHTLWRFSLAITPISSNFPVRRQRHHQSLSLQLCAQTPALQPPRHYLPRPIIMASNQPSQTASTPAAQNYTFPHSRLRLRQNDPSRTPLVLVACGSYSPVTHLHLRMFEMASDFVRFNTNFELLGGYFSPVSDQYRKAGLASAVDRYLNPASYMYSN